MATEKTKTINFQDVTALPLETHVYPNRAGGMVRVLTPHQGYVEIDLQYDGILDVYDTLTTKVVDQLQRLEYEAKKHLLEKWLAQVEN